MAIRTTNTRPVYKPVSTSYHPQVGVTQPSPYTTVSNTYHPITNPSALPKPYTPRDPSSPPANQPQTPAAAGGGANLPVDPYDFSGDPVLAQIKAMGVRSRQDAQDAALAARKQLAIDYGDSDYARNVLHDEATALAAANNPYSQRAQAKTGYDRGVTQIEDQLNKANLFYSGARGVKLGQAAHDYGQTLYGIGSQEQQGLGSIQDKLLAALAAANAQDAQAQQDAANRALQWALANGVDPGEGNPVARALVSNRFTRGD